MNNKSLFLQHHLSPLIISKFVLYLQGLNINWPMLNKLIAGILPYMPKKLVWVFSKRYIAGETIEDASGYQKNLTRKV